MPYWKLEIPCWALGVGKEKTNIQYPTGNNQKTIFPMEIDDRKLLVECFIDITKRKHAEAEREKLIEKLEKTLSDVKTLSGLLPICAS